MSGFVVSFLKLARSNRTAGTESFQGTMSNEGASSTKLRLSLDFSKENADAKRCNLRLLFFK